MTTLSIIRLSLVAITVFANFSLASLIITNNPKNIVNRVFFIVCILMSLWSLSLFLYEKPLIFNSLFWIKSTYTIVNFVFISILAFSFIFPKPIFVKARPWAILYSIFFILIGSYWLFLTDTWVAKVVIDQQKGLQTILGDNYISWVCALWGVLGWGVINFIINSKRSSGFQKLQLKYLFIAFGIWGVVNTIVDGIIPIIWHDTSYFSASAISGLVFTVPVTYTIIKHRFMDIRFIVARSISYTLLLLILGLFYAGGMFLISSQITHQQSSFASVIYSTVLALIIAYSFQPIRLFLEKITDKIFYKNQYDPQALLHSLSQTMALSATLSDLTYKILDLITKEMRISKAYFAIYNGKKFYIAESSHENKHVEITKEEIERLQSETTALVFDEIPESATKEMMRKNEIGVILPLRTRNHFIGTLLLGEKSSGDIYFDQDIRLLEIAGPELAVALQNAQRFEEIEHFNVVLKDEVKKATNDLRKAYDKLKDLDKLKDEFISLASHELRTPISSVKDYLWLALNKQKISTETKETLDVAYECTNRSIVLINDMLNVSRIEAGRIMVNPANFDLNALTKKVVEELKPKADLAKLEIRIESKNPVQVFADEDKIHEVIVNLIGNAIKYTPKGRVSISFEKDGDVVKTNVSDTGIGIKKSDQDKLFTKFGRVDSSFTSVSQIPGTGLGLYIAKNLVELSKGKIYVSSTPEQGSTFTFTLPKA